MSGSLLSGSPLDWALRYIKLGWAVFPLEGKKPIIREWQIAATLSESQVRDWWGRWPKANIGIRTGDAFFMFDVDLKSGGESDLDFLREQYGPIPDTIQQVTGTGGYHFLFQMPGFPVRNLQGAQNPLFGKGIDIRGIGGYMVAAPSVHPETGREYFWDGLKEIEEQKIAAAPGWMLDKLRGRTAAPPDPGKAAAPPIAERIHKGEGRHNVLVSIAGSMRRRGLSGTEMLPSLMAINLERCDPPYDEKHVRQIALSMEKYPAGKPYLPRQRSEAPPPPTETDEIPLNAADVEAAADKAITDDNLRTALELAPEIAKLPPIDQVIITNRLKEHFKRRWPNREQFERVLREAAPEGSRSPWDSTPPPEDDDRPDLSRQPHTDAGNGERIVALFGHDIRYCVEMQKWLIWDGKRWVVDEVGEMRQKGKEMARLMHEQAVKADSAALKAHARDSESYPAVTRALGFAATEKGIPILAADLDQHPFLLNCPNGVLDLRDKKQRLLRHDRNFLLTKLCPVEFNPAAQAPLFRNFILQTMGWVNKEAEPNERTKHLVGFIQRVLGYALTGDVSEKCIFVFHGAQGNNGKTTLLTLFRKLLGDDYAGQILIETVMRGKGSDTTARADLADLRGKRLITTSEVNKEDRLNEGQVKYITSGMSSPIKSRKLYENTMEFLPTHKLLMECNWLPRITGTDNAIWKRLRQIPFLVTIPDDEIDTRLPGKLLGEAAGILAWAARGCLAWLDRGLQPPDEVTKAAAEWREHDDPLKEFLDDCCEIDRGDTDLFAPARDIYAAYLKWAKDSGERYPLGREGFNDRLLSKQMKQSRHRKLGDPPRQTRCWEGMRLRPGVGF